MKAVFILQHVHETKMEKRSEARFDRLSRDFDYLNSNKIKDEFNNNDGQNFGTTGSGIVSVKTVKDAPRKVPIQLPNCKAKPAMR
jgi:hypothetical protein